MTWPSRYPARSSGLRHFGTFRRGRLIRCAGGFVAAAIFSASTDLVAAVPPAAAGPTVLHLKRLTLEELMSLEVTTVARRPQPFSSAASALSVITGDDVRRSGATTLADALRYSTGLEVARIDGRTWGVASRGFNQNASNKLLVMMDGRSLYTPLFSGVFWDVQDTELADLDRIEVVRGPGATMWGANAVNGVISIQTRHARDTLGSLVTTGGGSEERFFASARQGVRLGKQAFARVYAKTYHRDDMAFPNGQDTNDDAEMWQAGFRADTILGAQANALTFQGDIYRGFLGAANRTDSRVAGGNATSRWRHDFSTQQSCQVQFYYDRVERFVPGQFRESRDTFDLDMQYAGRTADRHDLLVGLSARTSADRTGRTGTIQFDPPDRRMNLVSAIVQDEIAFAGRQAGLTPGAKFEHNNSTGFEFQPSVRAAWRPAEDQTAWAAVSRAARTPSRFDDDLRFIAQPPTVLIRGDDGSRSEILTAYELGYRLRPHTGWIFDASVYYNHYDRLRSQERANEPGVFFVLRNRLNARTYGGEASVSGQLLPAWRVRTTYARLHKKLTLDTGSSDPTRGVQEGNDPRHIATVTSTWDVASHWEFDVMSRYVSSLPSPTVPGYTEMDVRLGWRPHPAWELSLIGQNLLHPRHREFGAGGPGAHEMERGFHARVTCRR